MLFDMLRFVGGNLTRTNVFVRDLKACDSTCTFSVSHYLVHSISCLISFSIYAPWFLVPSCLFFTLVLDSHCD